MSEVLEELNRELLSELYDLKKQLKTVRLEVQEKDKQIAGYENLEMEKHEKEEQSNEEIEERIAELEEKVAELEASNANLNQHCHHLHCENVYLTQQITILSSQNLQQSMMLHSHQTQQQKIPLPEIPTVQQVESQMKFKPKQTKNLKEEKQDSGSEMMGRTEDSYESQDKENEPKMNVEGPLKQCNGMDEQKNGAVNEKPGKQKLSTIAMKLKLSLSKDPSQEISPIYNVVVAPRFKKLAQENKIHSVMIGGLFRGLTQDDIVGYFGRFGNVVEYSEPVSSYSQNDGTKFVFLKFDDPSAVEKVVGPNSKHTINRISVIAKKSYKDL